jgi:SWI/SNF-related matrix-associated actin-dependent regulator 1 of chromatin subfamily A
METKIPEIEARNILSGYTGANNQLLEWKVKLLNGRLPKITRPQADYVLKYHQTIPKVAKKYLNLVISFGEKLQDEKLLVKPVEKIWCEKLLCESDKAYHIWGKMFDSEQNHAIWLPKGAVLQPEKKLNRVIDYSKYNHRPPLPWQPKAIESLLANDKFILADDMGLAKTSSSIIASLELEVKKILIVCPASVKINWKKEIEYYSKDKILIVEGRKWGSTFKYYIINYDILKNFHITASEEKKLEEKASDDLKLLINEKFDLAIIDESHYLSNSSSQRSKLMIDLLETIPKVWLLTGTPMANRPINYYNLLKIVDSPVALNWQHYVKRYCKGFRMKVNGRTIWNTSGASNLDELRERTKNLILRRMKSEIPGLPEKIISEIFLELKSTFYNEELEEFMRITEENKHRTSLNIETQEEEPDRENVVAILGRLMKVRQVLAFEKIPYTSELIDKCLESNKKCIVFSNFSMPIDMLHEKYPKNSIILDGRMTTTKRENAISRFQTDPKIKILIAQIVAGGIGINLTVAEVVIMNDLSFVPSHHSQGEDRAYRTGQLKNVIVYYPIFENTIEQIIYNILQRKKGIIDQVMGDGQYSVGFGKELIKELL